MPWMTAADSLTLFVPVLIVGLGFDLPKTVHT